MKISLVTNNEDFYTYIENRTTGLSVLNRYRTLTDEREYAKFSNDFNHVDTFLFLDLQDLSKEFKEFIKYLNDGRAYFLNTEEILLVTWNDPTQSPTPDIETNLEAIQAYLEKANLKLRIVKLETLNFQDIYKSLTIADSMTDNAPKQFIKYKVVHNSEGIAVTPKKENIKIVPESLKGAGSLHKKEDLETAEVMESTIVNVPSVREPLRMEKNFKDFVSLAVMESTIVFVSGVRYAGKTTLALECAKELEEQNLSSVIIDLTGRKDMKMLNRTTKCDLAVIKGLNIEEHVTKQVVGVQVFKKVYTITFITNLIKSLVKGRSLVICEVDPDQLQILYKSFRGNKAALIVSPNNQIMLRDTINLVNSMDIPVVPVINKSSKTESDVDPQTLRDTMKNAKAVHDMDNMIDLVASLLR